MSWVSNFFHSLVNGAVGAAPVSTDTSKPIGGALAALNSTAATLGQTVTGIAVQSVDGLLEEHIGAAGTDAADLLLMALINEAQSRLSPTAAATSATIAAEGVAATTAAALVPAAPVVAKAA